MANVWKASDDVLDIVKKVQSLHHSPRLDRAVIAVCFDESKPFVKNKINLGRILKSSPLSRLWQIRPHDFCLVIPSDLWHSVLTDRREAYVDLQLTRCVVEYLPDTVEENGKKKPIKDEFGRVQYSTEPKCDEEGNPKWAISPADLEAFASNVRRYGLWLDELVDIKDAVLNNVPARSQDNGDGSGQ